MSLQGQKGNVAGRVGVLALVLAVGLPAAGQAQESPAPFQQFRQGHPQVKFPMAPEWSTEYLSGEKVLLTDLEEIWRPMCFNQAPMTREQVEQSRQSHLAEFAPGAPITVVDSPRRSSGVNIVFNLGGSVPPIAVNSFAIAEAYLEGVLGDPVTVTISVSFANLGSGIIGATGSNFVGNRLYSTVRPALVADMDPGDTIENSLPAGSTFPVRYVGTSATVTNASTVSMTRANYKAFIGSLSGTDADMQYNSNFNFDYDPSNGITGSQLSLVDTIVHEVGHALGFVSAADSQSGGASYTMDLYRFQRTDGTGDFNPDTLAEFGTTARLVDYNTPNDDHNTDLISVEYRMSDGTPYQASHFREQSPSIGIMDPALSGGQTFFPNYFRASDLAVFDAMGWNDVPGGGGCTSIAITTQPASTSACAGATVVFEVEVTGTAPTYEWRKNFITIPGEDGPTLTLTNVSAADAASYTVTVDNGCSSPVLSSTATLTINASTAISDQPDSQVVEVGDPVSFTVVASGTNLSYQWRKNFASIPGSPNAPTYTIPSASLGDAGNYTVTVTGSCGVLQSDVATLVVNEPAPDCPADYNGDGNGDVLDFLDFLDDYSACDGQPAPCGNAGNADVNDDGQIDILDFLEFLDAFSQGC
jgi:hypothetical protein